jgi:hypothetical protein
MLQFALSEMPPGRIESGSWHGRAAAFHRLRRLASGLLALAGGLLVGLCWPVSAAPPPGSALSEAATGQLYRRLTERRRELGPSLTRWSGVTLREAVAALEASLDVHVWLDRRLDPDQLVQLELAWEAPWDLVDALAATCGAAAAPLESVILIAPADQLASMLSGYWQLHAAMRSLSARAEPWRWEGVTEVSALLDELAARHRLQVAGDTSLPHDLWLPRRLPPLTPAAQWSLLLGGFGLQLTPDPNPSQRRASAGNWRIAVQPEAGQLELSGDGGLPDSDRLRAWRARWPEVSLRGSPDAWEISGSWSALLDLWWAPSSGAGSGSVPESPSPGSAAARRRPSAAARTTADRLANDRFTLQYRGTLAPLLERLAADLNLAIQPWPLPPTWQQREVQLHSEQLSIDQLLEQISQQVSLEIRREAPSRVQVSDAR